MKRLKHAAVTAWGLMLLAIFLLPPLVVLAGSFMSEIELEIGYFDTPRVQSLRLIPARFTLSQYAAALLGNTDYTRALQNTIQISVVSSVFAMLHALCAAYALIFCRIPAKRGIIVLYLILMILPYQALEMPQYLMLRELGLLGTHAAVILTNCFGTFEGLILAAFFQMIPQEQVEAAAMDGAGELRKLLLIVLPQMKQPILMIWMLKLIQVWNMTEQPILFLDDTTLLPMSVMLRTLSAKFSEDSFAFAVVFSLPLLLLAWLVKDDSYFAITTGRLKQEESK